jgi:hypothetical protein
MAHYAFLDENNIVTEVIVGRDEGDGDIDWEAHYASVRGLSSTQCKRTSYNTRNGEHVGGGTPYRHNYAGIGYRFDPEYGEDGGFFPPEPPADETPDPSPV